MSLAYTKKSSSSSLSVLFIDSKSVLSTYYMWQVLF